MSRLGQLSSEIRALEAKLREGGGSAKTERQHAQGKLTARERIGLLFDPGSRFLEVGLLLAYDKYDGQAPAAGVVTGLVTVHGRECVVVANDATVKAGSWWPGRRSCKESPRAGKKRCVAAYPDRVSSSIPPGATAASAWCLSRGSTARVASSQLQLDHVPLFCASRGSPR